MSEEVHPLVTLLTERMKTHPEEFDPVFDEAVASSDIRYRWARALEEIKHHGSVADRAAITVATRDVRLDKAHQWALDELMNGDDRRATEKRDREAYKAQMHANQRNIYAQQAMSLSQQSAVQLRGQLTGATAVSPTLPQPPTAWTSTRTTSLQLGNETLDESTISKIKKMLGI